MMSHAHLPFTLPCLGPCLPPAPNLWLLLLLFQIAWSLVLLWLREAQRWWSRKLTRQRLLWLRLLFVERVQKWRSPRTYWKNRENVPASANEIQAIFLLFRKRFLISQADHPLLVGAVVDWNLSSDLLLFIEEIHMNNTVTIICSKMQNLKQIFQ